MNILTNNDYRRIQAWIKANAIKDSDFAVSEDIVPNEDILIITQNMSTVPTNYRIRIKDLINSSLAKIIIDSITAKSVKVNNVLTVDAANVKLDNKKGTTLQDVLNYFEENKLNRHTDDTFDGNLTVKKNITIEGNIKSHDDTITVEADLEATGEITDGQGNILSNVNDASKGWKIEYQDPQQDEPTVRAKYVLKDYRGVPKGSVIKIYKDSAITNVYLGTIEDTCNPNTGEVTKHPIHDNNEALSIVYRLDTGKYSLVNVPIKMFTAEAEFDKYRGLGVTSNGQIFIKLASDVESSNYLHFNELGEITADGIETRILRDLGNIITSIAGDRTMWGVYKEHEGTQETSTPNDGSRWGEFKRAEEIREQIADSTHQVFADNWDAQDDDPELPQDKDVVDEASYAYNWKTTDTLASDGKREGNLKDLYNKTLENEEKVAELESEVSIINCNRLEGYNYTDSFTLQTGISAVPVDKRYAAKGITYLDEAHKIHLALFNSNSYGSGWEDIENWLLLDEEFIDLVYSRTFAPVVTKGYIDFDINQKKLIVSGTLYYKVGDLLKSIAADSYDIDLSVLSGNYGVLVIDSDLKLAFKDIQKIEKTDIVVASFAKAGDTITNVCHSVVPFRINGVDTIESIHNELLELWRASTIANSARKSNVVQSVVGEIYENRIEYSARKGDILSISLNGSNNLLHGDAQLTISGPVVLGTLGLGENITVKLPNDITYVKVTKNANNVIGSGDIELVVDMPLSIDNRIEANKSSIEANKSSINVIEQKLPIYNNYIVFEIGNISADGVNIDSTERSRSVNYIPIKGKPIIKIFPSADATYRYYDDTMQFLSSSYVEGASFIRMILITTEYQNRIITITDDNGIVEYSTTKYKKIATEEDVKENTERINELELKLKENSIEVQIAASTYESYIRTREEYLRDLYKSSVENAHWYGAEWREESGDNVIAINSDGDELLHSTLPIQNKMKRCIIKDSIVQYYLDSDNSDLKEDGTPAKLDGTDGNVMVELPEFFYRAEEETIEGVRTIRLKISEQGLDGFIFSPKRYTSAYEATLNRTNNRLVSVCTTLFERSTEEILTEASKYIVGTSISRGTYKTARRIGFTENASNYRGGTNDATLDNETDPASQNYSRNQLGLPIANVNRTQCRSYVDNLNREFIYQYDTHKVLWMLAMVEFKKKDVTTGTGMSVGANVYPNYSAYEAYFSPQGGISCLPCGITNSLGNKTGTVYFRMINVPVSSTGSSSSIVYDRWADVWMPCLSYRGVEHWFGHIYKIADGVNILCEGTGTYYEGKEGDSNYEYNDVTYWYQKNPYLTNDGGIEKQKLGTFRYMSGTREIKSILGGSKMHILPIDADVTSYKTHYCDCVEIYHRGGIMYPTFNGRIVSGVLDGANFIVGNNLANNGSPRASDGTRLDIL